MKHIIITIKRDGSMRFIYDDRLRGLLQHGDASIKRASHVEPGDSVLGQDPLKWMADMLPSDGPALGPFDTRQEALDAEAKWLNEHVLPQEIS